MVFVTPGLINEVYYKQKSAFQLSGGNRATFYEITNKSKADFSYQMIPSDRFGGGVTYGSSFTSAKIISSDENNNGIDFNHLAHELGHVLGLCHLRYDCFSFLPPGSPGTVMCPSGFRRDNPDKNSQENRENIEHPLFRFRFGDTLLPVPTVDCQDDTDCGHCPSR
ncbi:MAG: hypothetical protein MRK02_06420 [Candidatus Scalindua sp.]|nr:hypothetical protein [Candidatus Scalindua sp.]